MILLSSWLFQRSVKGFIKFYLPQAELLKFPQGPKLLISVFPNRVPAGAMLGSLLSFPPRFSLCRIHAFLALPVAIAQAHITTVLAPTVVTASSQLFPCFYPDALRLPGTTERSHGHVWAAPLALITFPPLQTWLGSVSFRACALPWPLPTKSCPQSSIQPTSSLHSGLYSKAAFSVTLIPQRSHLKFQTLSQLFIPHSLLYFFSLSFITVWYILWSHLMPLSSPRRLELLFYSLLYPGVFRYLCCDHKGGTFAEHVRSL